MGYHAWFEHFKEQLQGLTEAFERSESSLSLLAFALKNGHLKSEDYFKWAMNHYQLPKLQDAFFKETPMSQEMFAKWATHYPWSEECLPVAEWDGSLIVACLHPPQDFPTNPPYIPVLASPECIEQSWLQIHPRSERKEPVLKVATEQAPEGIDLSIKPSTKKTNDAFSFEDLGLGESVESDSLESSLSDESSPGLEVIEEGLAGIFDEAPVTSLQALTPLAKKESPLPEESATSPSPLVKNPLESKEKTEVTQASNSSVIIDDLSLNTPAPTAPLPEVAPAIEVAKIVPSVGNKSGDASEKSTLAKVEKPQLGAAVIAATKQPPPPPPKSAIESAEVDDENSFGNKPIPLTPRPVGVAKPTLNPVASGHFALDKIKKKNSSVINEKIKLVLSEMKAYFEKSMILTLDEDESQLTAFAWDENFQGIKDSSSRFPLKTPSIFNIVAATQKPFHGYISLNEINEKFFEDWNQGKIPDHVTITPIIVNEKVAGMLMGFAEKSAYNKASLNLAEKLSNEFMKGLQAA